MNTTAANNTDWSICVGGRVWCTRCARWIKNRGWASHRKACQKRWAEWENWCRRDRG